jgi:hypothetical protein
MIYDWLLEQLHDDELLELDVLDGFVILIYIAALFKLPLLPLLLLLLPLLLVLLLEAGAPAFEDAEELVEVVVAVGLGFPDVCTTAASARPLLETTNVAPSATARIARSPVCRPRRLFIVVTPPLHCIGPHAWRAPFAGACPTSCNPTTWSCGITQVPRP